MIVSEQDLHDYHDLSRLGAGFTRFPGFHRIRSLTHRRDCGSPPRCRCIRPYNLAKSCSILKILLNLAHILLNPEQDFHDYHELPRL